MSWTLLKGTLHQRRAGMFWFCVGLVFYSWLMVWFWPKMGGARYAKIAEGLPKQVLQMFGGKDVSFASLGGFFQTEYLGLMWMLIVASAVIAYAVRAFAGEIGDGTLELLLAQPVSRVRFAIVRVLGLVFYAVLLAVSTFVPILVFGPRYDIHLSAATFWSLMALGTLFMLAVGGVGMLASAGARDGGKPAAIASGLLVTMWVLDLVSSFSKAADLFTPVNLVSQWKPGVLINGGHVGGEVWWLYAIVSVATLAVSVLVFARRDVA